MSELDDKILEDVKPSKGQRKIRAVDDEKPRRKKRKVVKVNYHNEGSINTAGSSRLTLKSGLPALFLITVLVLLGCLAVLHFLSQKPKAKEVEYSPAYLIPTYEEEIIVPKSTPIDKDDLVSAEQILKSFLSAKNASEAAFFICDRQESLAEFKKHFQPFPASYEVKTMRALEFTNDSRSVVYNLRYNGIRSEVHLTAEPGGEFQVDWRSFYLCGDLPLEQYLKELPEGETVLYAYLSPDQYYTSSFPDKEYQSFIMRDLRDTYRLFGYVKRLTDPGLKIRNGLRDTQFKQKGKKVTRVIMKVRLKEKTPYPTVEILEVYTANWVSNII